jgi:hopanoid biosynthesis associated RND transporter like protein HpnN
MTIQSTLAGLVTFSRRRAIFVALLALLAVALGGFVAAKWLGVSTETEKMFPESLSWRVHQTVYERNFPQFTNLLIAVVDARIPEEADATADGLLAALGSDHEHFIEVRRPDSSPYLKKEGLLLLDQPELQATIDTIIGAQPFLGSLSADPTSRGVFDALSLIGTGVERGQSNLDGYLSALTSFHNTMAQALAGKPEPLSWEKLLGGKLADLGSKYKFVTFRVKPQFGTLKPGGEATDAIRAAAAKLEFVSSGAARVRITGPVALADDEFASVIQGYAWSGIGSLLLITLWLYLAVRTWRLIVPILLTLGTGLVLTLAFAATAVGTLNLVSVGFGILFVGIAVDFAIQFSVRFRETRTTTPDIADALSETGRRVGGQILVASATTAAGFLAFVPTEFRGVAELGLIAGVGMLIAFFCTLFFLPAFIVLFQPSGEANEIGFRAALPADAALRRYRRPILVAFGTLAALAIVLLPQLRFDPDPLHTKNPNTESMRTLYDLIDSPFTNPFTVDLLRPDVDDAVATAKRLGALPLVSSTLTVQSFVPTDQDQKLALLSDADALLGPTLRPPTDPPALDPDQIRAAATKALKSIDPALTKVAADHPLAAIARDLRQIAASGDSALIEMDRALTRFLPMQIGRLRAMLNAEPVALKDLPTDLTRDWVLPDGRARVQLVPKPMGHDSASLRRFSNEILPVAPDAVGAAVIVVQTADTIIGAFREAAITALVAIAAILFLALRRPTDVALVMAPLLISALLTVLVAVVVPLPLNFANIIALPLLLGVGVSFNIYFAMNWRAGQSRMLSSPTARAIVFSALTTGTAFGSLALSAHPGTASMGTLLLVSLGCTLVASLVFEPALLATVPRHPSRNPALQLDGQSQVQGSP